MSEHYPFGQIGSLAEFTQRSGELDVTVDGTAVTGDAEYVTGRIDDGFGDTLSVTEQVERMASAITDAEVKRIEQ